MDITKLTLQAAWWRFRWIKQFVERGQWPKFRAPFWFQTELGRFRCPDPYGPMFFEKGWEQETMKVISQLKDGYFVDVGANIGVYSMLAAKNRNRVLAIEANPQVYDALKATITANRMEDRITAVNAAAWSKPGSVVFDFTSDTCLGHVEGHTSYANYKTKRQECIAAVTLDSLICEKPSLMKLDIEWAEPEALKGAAKIIAWKTPMIFEAIDKEHLDACRKLLVGYNIIKLGERNYYAT